MKIAKKISVFIFVALVVATIFGGFVGGAVATAAAPTVSKSPLTSDFQGGKGFLSAPTWYSGSVDSMFSAGKSPWHPIFLITANIVNIAFWLVGVLSVVFIIYGGFVYMTSAGETGKVANGKNTLLHAIVGLIIALVGRIAITTIAAATFGDISTDVPTSAGGITPDNGGVPEWTVNLGQLLSLAYYIAGALAVVMIIYSGIQFITSSGDPGKATKARQTLLFSLVGLAVIVLAYAITNFATSKFVGSAGDAEGLIGQITSGAFYVVGVLAVVMIIYSGMRYIYSGGNASQAQKARQSLLYSVVGLAVAILAYAIINFVMDRIK